MCVYTFIYENFEGGGSKTEQLAVVKARREAAEEELRILEEEKRKLEAEIDQIENPTASQFFLFVV